MIVRAAVLASAAALLVPELATAQTPLEGFYIGGGAGWNRFQEPDADLTIGGVTVSDTLESNNGFAVIGQAGYQFGNGLRLEFEPGYRRNTSDLAQLSLMGNVLYEFSFGGFRPYLGAGIGAVRVSVDASESVGGDSLDVDDESWELGYQGIVGLGYQLSPNLIAAIDYRYFRTGDVEADAQATIGGAGFSGDLDFENTNHTVLASVRYVFGAPPPAPPPPPPAPAAAPPPPPVAQTQTFLVFFDFDSANLTTAARDTITTAVNAVRAGGSARVEIVGHTDTSGSPQYNQRLGQRRADAVRAEMVQQGLPQSIITTASAGESQLRVPTADGVREAQNRRAEIILPPG